MVCLYARYQMLTRIRDFTIAKATPPQTTTIDIFIPPHPLTTHNQQSPFTSVLHLLLATRASVGGVRRQIDTGGCQALFCCLQFCSWVG